MMMIKQKLKSAILILESIGLKPNAKS